MLFFFIPVSIKPMQIPCSIFPHMQRTSLCSPLRNINPDETGLIAISCCLHDQAYHCYQMALFQDIVLTSNSSIIQGPISDEKACT